MSSLLVSVAAAAVFFAGVLWCWCSCVAGVFLLVFFGAGVFVLLGFIFGSRVFFADVFVLLAPFGSGVFFAGVFCRITD